MARGRAAVATEEVPVDDLLVIHGATIDARVQQQLLELGFAEAIPCGFTSQLVKQAACHGHDLHQLLG